MPYFTTPDGCRLFFEIRSDDPDKPFVVFLNGFTQTTVYWYGLVPKFCKHFSMLLYDARGQGSSGKGKNPPTLDQHVSDLSQLLAHLKIHPTHLVGLSHGARVALSHAAACPSDVLRLVLCGIGARDSRKTRHIIDSWHAILEAGDLAAMAEAILPKVFGSAFLKKYNAIMTDIAAAVVERNQKDALLAQLKTLPAYPPPASKHIEGPIDCLVLVGDQDPLVTTAEAAELAAHLQADHQVIPNAGHSLPVEAPDEFSSRVLNFLAPSRRARPHSK